MSAILSDSAAVSLATEGELDRELRLQSELNESKLAYAELQEQHLLLIERTTEAKRYIIT